MHLAILSAEVFHTLQNLISAASFMGERLSNFLPRLNIILVHSTAEIRGNTSLGTKNGYELHEHFPRLNPC